MNLLISGLATLSLWYDIFPCLLNSLYCYGLFLLVFFSVYIYLVGLL